MDNQRLLIWAIFGLTAWMTYQAWMLDYGPQSVPVQSVNEAPGEQASEGALPELLDSGEAIGEVIDAPSVEPVADMPTTSAPAGAATIQVRTDVLDVTISTQGGTLTGARLLNYPVTKDRPSELVELLTMDPARISLIQSGLRGSAEGAEANHLAMFSGARESYDLDGADEIVVPLTWTDGNGITVEKRYRLTRGSYTIGLEQTVTNNSDAAWRGAEYVQIQRYLASQERSMFDVDSYSFNGPIVYDGEKSEKLTRDDLVDDGARSFSSERGWLGTIQHHFVTAVVPEPDTKQRFSVSARGDRSVASAIGSPRTVEPGTSQIFSTTVFVGPKLQSQLEEIDKSLKLTVDYGLLTIISQPLFWLLSKAFDLFGNWGVAIIAVTALIKLAFYKLTESSGRSMAKMRNLQPRIKAMQERYKDDKQAQSQAMMELYKREKVNPAAGCLPILIQMPFFLAFYWVLLESVEMRQAPFVLWLTDLSTRDPFFILPLIMGAAMFFQQKLNPQVGDPVQVKVMQIMPIIFTVFFAFFPSGLVLYWVTNTLLSIAQQWKINKVVEAESKQEKGGKKTKKA
jgi:YidC/Oxa1 family membrane protein insertase